MFKLYDWNEISSAYNGSLLIGNGASISINDRFRYSSLLEEGIKSGFITGQTQSIFEHYSTSDFEFILRVLSTTNTVNKLLEIDEDKTHCSYSAIREALVKTVRQVHCVYNETVKYLPLIGNFLEQFNTIFSLNYDLLLYWTILWQNTQLKYNRFKDCFINGEFENDYGFLRNSRNTNQKTTLVFYPHGNLALVTDPFGAVSKVCQNSQSKLLDTILANWQIGSKTPLFVSESDSDKKLRAIRRSNYLNTVYSNELSRIKDNLVIYGWSIADQDKHILDALGKGNIKKLAISVYKPNPEWEHWCYETTRKVKKTSGLDNCQVQFFDAQSSGVWIME